MHAAMSSHNMARNFPCCHKYVLHVSQMVWDTSAMEACTGSDLVCQYCTSPNPAPMAHIKMPKYISVWPLRPCKPSKVTAFSSGILILASLARRPAAHKHKRKVVSLAGRIFLACIMLSLQCQ